MRAKGASVASPSVRGVVRHLASTILPWLRFRSGTTIPYEERAPLTGDRETDVLVIGAGIAGLSCAWHLAERGVDCTVVEARTAAGGASGRNGGFLVAGAAPAHQDAIALFGHEIAVGIYRATLASEQRDLRDRRRDRRRASTSRASGYLRVTWEPEELEHARIQYEAMRADDLPAEWVDEADLPAIVRRRVAWACSRRPTRTMHPARWVRAFSRAIEERGVRIFERSPVPGAARSGAQRRLRRAGRRRHRARPARRGGG